LADDPPALDADQPDDLAFLGQRAQLREAPGALFGNRAEQVEPPGGAVHDMHMIEVIIRMC